MAQQSSSPVSTSAPVSVAPGSEPSSQITLLQAVARGDVALVKNMLAGGTAADWRDKETGQTPLIVAAARGSQDIVSVLLQSKADVNAETHQNVTALHLAAEAGSLEIVGALIEAKANTNTERLDGVTPICHAIMKNHLKMVEKLIENKAILNDLALAAVKCDFKMIKALVDGKTDANRFPLNRIAQIGAVDVLEYLLSANANIQQLKPDSLMAALEASSPAYLEDLLKYKADIKGFQGRILVEKALERNKVPILAKLLELNAHFIGSESLHYGYIRMDSAVSNFITANPWSLCVWGMQHSSQEARAVLTSAYEIYQKKKQQASEKDAKGHTALHRAVMANDLAEVKEQIYYQADPNAPDATGQTALHLAAAAGNFELVNSLLWDRASVTVTDSNQQTPLHKAAQNGHHKVVEQLLKARDYQGTRRPKVDPLLIKDEKEQTPYDLAIAKGHQQVVNVILEKLNIKTETQRRNRITAAFESNDADMIGFLLTLKVSKTPPAFPFDPALLFKAVTPGKETLLAALLKSGANPDLYVDDNSFTALSYAAGTGNPHSVRALLAAKAQVAKGKNLLARAIKSGSDEVLTALLEAKADAGNVQADPLHYAVDPHYTKFNEAIFRQLIAAKAPLDTLDAGGYTPLHLAAKTGNLVAVQILLENKADRSKKEKDNFFGNTASDMAKALKDNPAKDKILALLNHKSKKASVAAVTMRQLSSNLYSLNSPMGPIGDSARTKDGKAAFKPEPVMSSLAARAAQHSIIRSLGASLSPAAESRDQVSKLPNTEVPDLDGEEIFAAPQLID